MSSPEEWYRNLPVVTRYYFSAAVIATIATSVGIVGAELMYLDFEAVFFKRCPVCSRPNLRYLATTGHSRSSPSAEMMTRSSEGVFFYFAPQGTGCLLRVGLGTAKTTVAALSVCVSVLGKIGRVRRELTCEVIHWR